MDYLGGGQGNVTDTQIIFPSTSDLIELLMAPFPILHSSFFPLFQTLKIRNTLKNNKH